jgi:hypothetical protein
MLNRRHLITSLALGASALVLPAAAQAQTTTPASWWRLRPGAPLMWRRGSRPPRAKDA